MAIYHCTIKIIKRSQGDSAVAAAAYQSGSKLRNQWDGKEYDFSKKEGVICSEILLPPHAPASFSDRNTLWNSVEISELRGDAQVARSFEVSFPKELSLEEDKKLIKEYLQQFVDAGMCVDYAIHDPNPPGHNPHCHFLLTMRPLDENGKWLPKSKLVYDLDDDGNRIKNPNGKWKTHKENLVDWNDKNKVLQWRESWADVVNRYLESNGIDERIDHRSHAERGLEEIPTIHMGVAACAMEKKGIMTERGEINRQIKAANRLIQDIREKVQGLTAWIATLKEALHEMLEAPQSPFLGDLVFRYLDLENERLQKYSPKFRLKERSANFNQLQPIIEALNNRGIRTLEEFESALRNLRSRSFDTQQKVVDAENRMKELEQLISKATSYKKLLPIRRELQKIKWKKSQEKFKQEHLTELNEWQAASKFLHSKGIDTKALSSSLDTWKIEMSMLRKTHGEDYALLKEQRAEIKQMDDLHRKVEKVVSRTEKQIQQKHDKEI